MLIENDTYVRKKKKCLHKKRKDSPVFYDKKMKGYKCEIWFKMSARKLQKPLRSVENSTFIRGSAEAAVGVCSVINSKENTRGGVLFYEGCQP